MVSAINWLANNWFGCACAIAGMIVLFVCAVCFMAESLYDFCRRNR